MTVYGMQQRWADTRSIERIACLREELNYVGVGSKKMTETQTVNKSSQRPHTSAKENMARIRNPYPDTDSI